MNKMFAGVQIGRKNVAFGIGLFILLGFGFGIPLTVNFFGGSLLTQEQYQVWKVIHGYGVFLGFINYFFGLSIDRLPLTDRQKELSSWAFLIAAVFGGVFRMILAILSAMSQFGLYAFPGRNTIYQPGRPDFPFGSVPNAESRAGWEAGRKENGMKSNNSWWKGKRGEWYVIAQFILFILVPLGPRSWPGWQPWSAPYLQIGSLLGVILLIAGGGFIFAGVLSLGVNLTAVPYPKEKSTLVETGPYRFVRHPMYCGGILMAFGWALYVQGWLTIAYALLLVVFFDFKSRLEEKWLRDKFSGYRQYQARVRKLIPYIY